MHPNIIPETVLHHKFCIQHLFSSASSFSFIYPIVSSGTQSINSHAAKMEVLKQKILEMNTRGDSRITEGEREG